MTKAASRVAAREAKRKRERQRALLMYGGLGLLAILILGGGIYLAVNRLGSTSGGALMGTEIPVTSRDHVPVTTDPGPYNSDPPAQGRHFPDTLPTKFYQESDLANLPAHPEGYLVHNLEHGYVIFWYNCQAKPGIDCNTLKQSIQKVMEQNGGTKLIAFPWSKLDTPLAMTSWGRLLKLDSADEATMTKFVKSNRYQAPEPNAD